MAQSGQNDNFGQNELILFRTGFWHSQENILAHFGLKRSILVHLGPPTVLWHRTLATPGHRRTVSIDPRDMLNILQRIYGVATALPKMYWTDMFQNDHNLGPAKTYNLRGTPADLCN